MTYYIAGPMTGIEGHNYPAFEKATAHLRRDGLKVLSPHEFFPPPGEDFDPVLGRIQRLRKDVSFLSNCDATLLLPGWSESRGARMELNLALELGMRVYYFHNNEVVYNVS